jgi:hypothetical protein
MRRQARREELVLEKKFVAIVENPLYSVMNEPNSTLQRLIRKLNLLDASMSSPALESLTSSSSFLTSSSLRLAAAGRAAPQGHRVPAQGKSVRHRLH